MVLHTVHTTLGVPEDFLLILNRKLRCKQYGAEYLSGIVLRKHCIAEAMTRSDQVCWHPEK